MGTNTPHTCSPGLVWQKQARPFSQFELKVGKLRIPIHLVCVSAALYHRGYAAAISREVEHGSKKIPGQDQHDCLPKTDDRNSPVLWSEVYKPPSRLFRLQTSDLRLQRHLLKQDCRKSKPILVGLRSCG